MNSVRSLAFDSQQTTDAGWVRIPTNMAALNVIPGAVGAVAYGRFRAPDYMRHPGEYIPETPTRTGTPAIQGFNAIDF